MKGLKLNTKFLVAIVVSLIIGASILGYGLFVSKVKREKEISILGREVSQLKEAIDDLKFATPSAMPTQTVIEPTTKPSEPKITWDYEKAEQFKRVAIEGGYSEEAIDLFLRNKKAEIQRANEKGLSAEEYWGRERESRTINALEDISWQLQMIKIRL